MGRKLILGENVASEVQAVRQAFQDKTMLAGFYSNGEISPFNEGEGGQCQLHNQTMTITSFYED